MGNGHGWKDYALAMAASALLTGASAWFAVARDVPAVRVRVDALEQAVHEIRAAQQDLPDRVSERVLERLEAKR